MTDKFQEYLDGRPRRDKVQEEYISRIVDTMDIKDLAQYAFDTLDEQMGELTDEQLYEEVEHYYPDLLENE